MTNDEAIKQLIGSGDRDFLSISPAMLEQLIARTRFQNGKEMYVDPTPGFTIIKILREKQSYADAARLVRNENEKLHIPTVSQLFTIREQMEGTFTETYYARAGSRNEIYCVNMLTGEVTRYQQGPDNYSVMFIRLSGE